MSRKGKGAKTNLSVNEVIAALGDEQTIGDSRTLMEMMHRIKISGDPAMCKFCILLSCLSSSGADINWIPDCAKAHPSIRPVWLVPAGAR